MKTNPVAPAFNNLEHSKSIQNLHGLTKREYFAILALQGLLADTGSFFPDQQGTGQLAAQAAVKYADALIAELNKDQNDEE